MMKCNGSCVVAFVLAAASTATPAQPYADSDPRSSQYQEHQRRENERRENEARTRQNAEDMYGSKPSSPQLGGPAGTTGSADLRALGQKLLRTPPLPVERNVLLGRWRLEGTGKARAKNDNEILRAMLTDTEGWMQGSLCEASFGSGIEFKPTTFNSDGIVGVAAGPVAYRSGANKKVIVAIPADKRANPMSFDVSNPNRIVNVNVGNCALVRVGVPAANAAANAAAAPGNARAAASSPSAPRAAGGLPQVAAVAPAPPPSTLSRPSPEVCRNTLLDKLGTVGTNQVRAMSDVRFREAAIEGKVPNSNNLRIDLRGSACDDPRIKATLYDFDANEMLQSITYVWNRPPGPAPAPIFQERVSTLSRFHSLPPPQSPGRLQADTSLGRPILQDMPERNLLLEAYKK